MRRSLVIPALLLCLFPVAAFGAQDSPKNSSDVFVFLNALALSYNNYHPEARAQFEQYKHNHPDDLLSRLRIMYDHSAEVHFKDMDEATYRELLGEVNEAISVFETKGCSGTDDLIEIAGNTLDCEYIAAALYSFRAALRGNHAKTRWGQIKILMALHADDVRFFDHGRKSNSTMVKFLLGVHEYELSQNSSARYTGLPHDVQEAFRLIKSSLVDDSPFADDIWFYVLQREIENPDATREVFADTPPAVIVARLRSKYPNHKYPVVK